jgi:hypothetical protein
MNQMHITANLAKMCTIINFITMNHITPTENLNKLCTITNLVTNNPHTPTFGHIPLQKAHGVFI